MPSARLAEAVDFMTHEDGKWQGHHLLSRAVLAALDKSLRGGKPVGAGEPGQGPLSGRAIMLVGTNGLSRVLAASAQHAGAIPVIAGSDQQAAQALAQSLGCRFVLEEAVHATPHDVLLRCDTTDLHAGYLKPGMTVVDVTALPRPSRLLDEAGERGCQVVSPQLVLVELVKRYLRALTGETVPGEFLFDVLRPLRED
jgi:shikimate 5-dehydrogenase